MQLSNIWELRKKFVDTSTTGLFKLKNMRICWGIYSIKMYVWTVFLDLEIWLFGSKIKVINVACSRHAFLLFRNLLRCCVFLSIMKYSPKLPWIAKIYLFHDKHIMILCNLILSLAIFTIITIKYVVAQRCAPK